MLNAVDWEKFAKPTVGGLPDLHQEENNDCGNMSDDSMESVSLLAMYKEENRDKEEDRYKEEDKDKEENRGKEENRNRDNNNDNKRSVGALEAVRNFRKTNKASFIDIWI